MNLRFLVVIAMGLANASSADAQREARIGVSAPQARDSHDADSTIVQKNDVGTMSRFVASAMLATGGIVIGANAGASMSGPCGCDDPGLAGAVFGGLIGNALGASIGAAAPTFGSVCSLNERMGRSILGSVAGTVIGMFSFTAAPIGLFSIPLGAAGGSVLALGHCLKSRAG
jgi:hypothetical protein